MDISILFLTVNGMMKVGAQSAIDKIVTTGFRAIQLIYFFTAGADEVKCWQIRKHTKAPQVRLFLLFIGAPD